ncbi:uncharacterized protein LOC126797581 [Argentina anserina]|uniref:uncharacterized protein LOC126797581 n=1 Tax=Argentina anserina TaxID=57926 RepID=UPI0021767360|nr:uncharacterized protein LOC126797581 [Potentilla anserina]
MPSKDARLYGILHCKFLDKPGLGTVRLGYKCYYTEPGFLNDVFDVSRYWTIGISASFFSQTARLQSRLRREIQALIQEDVDIIKHHTLGVIKSLMSEKKGQTKTSEAKQRISRDNQRSSKAFTSYKKSRTEQFVNEVELFLSSDLNVEAYDTVCMQRLGSSAREVTTEAAAGELAIVVLFLSLWKTM